MLAGAIKWGIIPNLETKWLTFRHSLTHSTPGIVDDVVKDIKIEKDNSIFELGCGTGAALKRLRSVYGPSIKIGGSDISSNAIEVAKKAFPDDEEHFYVISMTEKNTFVPDNSQDIVLSYGAFAMYLYKDDMEVALTEALR